MREIKRECMDAEIARLRRQSARINAQANVMEAFEEVITPGLPDAGTTVEQALETLNLTLEEAWAQAQKNIGIGGTSQ